ncbi:hypothetical protein HD806DRAFT_259029 [Xylariaceae sp. AK1471]|nr:hypothetical protein HD806DRAFT_259029 [Xylariaceae sp. AK1471]
MAEWTEARAKVETRRLDAVRFYQARASDVESSVAHTKYDLKSTRSDVKKKKAELKKVNSKLANDPKHLDPVTDEWVQKQRDRLDYYHNKAEKVTSELNQARTDNVAAQEQLDRVHDVLDICYYTEMKEIEVDRKKSEDEANRRRGILTLTIPFTNL